QSTFFFQFLHTARHGSLDTSLVSSDNINNPRTMNAIYNLPARLEAAKRWGRETLGPDNLANKQFNDFINQRPLSQFFQPPNTVWTPHILKDGSDSVGALGALNRVYLNIGLFSEEWLLHFNAVAGGKPITPIEIAVAQRNSVYWRATEAATPAVANFFLQAAKPDYLADAPGGSPYLNATPEQLDRGKTVFAETCARCHSSKTLPEVDRILHPGCLGPNYLACWNEYWAFTKTEDYKRAMRD